MPGTGGHEPACAQRLSYSRKSSGPDLDDDKKLSCSALEALLRQECFVNGLLAQHAPGALVPEWGNLLS